MSNEDALLKMRALLDEMAELGKGTGLEEIQRAWVAVFRGALDAIAAERLIAKEAQALAQRGVEQGEQSFALLDHTLALVEQLQSRIDTLERGNIDAALAEVERREKRGETFTLKQVAHEYQVNASTLRAARSRRRRK